MRKCRDFDHSKPEEVKIRQLFVPTMDNSDRKRNDSATDNKKKKKKKKKIFSVCVMIHISGYFTYLAMIWSRYGQISEGPLYFVTRFLSN